jgi:ankyrin repeat protein
MASTYGHLDLVKYLIQKGVDINYQSNQGNTALMMATLGFRVDVVKFLLENKADISLQNKGKQTCVDIAESYNFFEISQLIEKYNKL